MKRRHTEATSVCLVYVGLYLARIPSLSLANWLITYHYVVLSTIGPSSMVLNAAPFTIVGVVVGDGVANYEL